VLVSRLARAVSWTAGQQQAVKQKHVVPEAALGVRSAVPLCLILMCALHVCVQILLVTEQGLVLEGTQTNFFAVVDDTVYTAEEGVLMGTVRGVVLEVGFKCTFCHVCTKTRL